jgi:hypothetical protein
MVADTPYSDIALVEVVRTLNGRHNIMENSKSWQDPNNADACVRLRMHLTQVSEPPRPDALQLEPAGFKVCKPA